MTVLTARGELVDEIAGIIQDARAERFNPDASTHTAARRILDFLGNRERRQDDEIERRISECETHRVLIDAVRAEREAERPFDADAKPADIGWKGIAAACQRLHAARAHRRAIVDSLPADDLPEVPSA